MKPPKQSVFVSTTLAILGAVFFSSCTSHTGRGTGIGAAVGGGIGALASGSTEGALIGAGIGAGVGALVGNEADKRAQRSPYQSYPQQDAPYGQGDISQPSPQPDQQQSHPWGRQRAPGVATSPHPPYNDIDIRGYRRGELVVDPTTDRIFRVP